MVNNMMKVYNTGETPKMLKEKYNPEGSILRKAQMRMLDMLLYIDGVCKKLNIEYRLDSGNVLGAVRHGGFIPWDDDVDIVILRKDCPKLCKYLLENPHPQYVLQYHKTDPGYCGFWPVLRDLKSEYIQNSDVHNARKYRGLQVDIFPLEEGLTPFFIKISGHITYLNEKHFVLKHKKIADIIYRFQKYIIHPVFRFLDVFTGAKDTAMYAYGISCGTNIPKSFLKDYKPILFEEHYFPGPSDPYEYCKKIYGNYMKLPPIDKRDHHKAQYKIWD